MSEFIVSHFIAQFPAWQWAFTLVHSLYCAATSWRRRVFKVSTTIQSSKQLFQVTLVSQSLYLRLQGCMRQNVLESLFVILCLQFLYFTPPKTH